MTPEEQKTFFQAVGSFVHEQVQKQTATLQKEIDDLKATLVDFGYRGVWSEGTEYKLGNFVTHNGSLFHCNTAATKNRPERDPVSWSLCCKRGADAPAAKRMVMA